jgi:hypothetical protein
VNSTNKSVDGIQTTQKLLMKTKRINQWRTIPVAARRSSTVRFFFQCEQRKKENTEFQKK